ncbi:methyltransferase [Trichophyton rubrum]|uniref:Methyltransferase n=4 Tax=Trichophyton TaxID=5550 RepID=A0A178ETJ7_TRIRU|nr:methyltransferase [Trichophyton rubrum]
MSLRPCLRNPLLRRISPLSRAYAVQTPGNPTLEVFNRRTKLLQKDRAAKNVDTSRQVDYLKDEVAMRLSDRLLVGYLRHRHTIALLILYHSLLMDLECCNIARALTSTPISNGEGGASTRTDETVADRISKITCIEESRSLLYRDKSLPFNSQISITREVIPSIENLPYEPNTFDAVLSSLSMHWINDLPSLLAQVNSILKPDSPFMAVMFGGDTLFELRTSLQLADLERRGGVSPHVSPLADVRDIGGLLTKAGFKLLTVDVEDIVVEYPDTFALMSDLQAMGESNAILRREAGPISRDVLLANEAIYRSLHTEEGERNIPATFRLIYMIGWKEGEGQSKPLERGSGQFNLKDIIGSE